MIPSSHFSRSENGTVSYYILFEALAFPVFAFFGIIINGFA
jgi:hypothetical protein